MKSRQEYVDVLRAHATELQAQFGISSMSLFGSVARGDHNDESDVDVLVDMPATLREYDGAQVYLENLLNCHVDLVRNHKYLNSLFIKHVNKDAITIF